MDLILRPPKVGRENCYEIVKKLIILSIENKAIDKWMFNTHPNGNPNLRSAVKVSKKYKKIFIVNEPYTIETRKWFTVSGQIWDISNDAYKGPSFLIINVATSSLSEIISDLSFEPLIELVEQTRSTMSYEKISKKHLKKLEEENKKKDLEIERIEKEKLRKEQIEIQKNIKDKERLLKLKTTDFQKYLTEAQIKADHLNRVGDQFDEDFKWIVDENGDIVYRDVRNIFMQIIDILTFEKSQKWKERKYID